MKVVVTGGAGFIGSHIVDLLEAQGIDTVVIDNLSTGYNHYLPKGVTFYKRDLNTEPLEDIFHIERPDYVIHQAAQVDVSKSIHDPTFDARTNIIGTIKLLQQCQSSHVKKIIYASSCAVYGETGDRSISESEPIKPSSFYGVSKYTPEAYIQLFHKEYHLPYTILRYANVYGPRQTPKGEGGVVSIFFDRLSKQHPITIFGDGEQTRDFIFVKDVAKANVLALDHADNQIINIGTDTKTSINELCRLVQSFFKEQTQVSYQPPRKGDIKFSRLNNHKAKVLLNLETMYDLKSGLAETFSSMNRRDS